MLGNQKTIILVIITIILLVVIYRLLGYLINQLQLNQTKYLTIKIIPSITKPISRDETTKFLLALAGINKKSSLISRFFQIKNTVCLMINSSKDDGISYLLRADSRYKPAIIKMIYAYLPEAGVSLIKYNNQFNQIEKLKVNSNLVDNIDINYLLNAISQPHNNEAISIELVLSPIISHQAKNHLISNLLFGLTDAVGLIFNDCYNYKAPVKPRLRPNHLVKTPTNCWLFETDIYFLIRSNNISEYTDAINLALSSSSSHYKLIRPLLQAHCRNLINNSQLSQKPLTLSPELASSFFSFPGSLTSQVDCLKTNLFHTLSYDNDSSKKIDLVLGDNVHHQVKTPIALTKSEHQKHMFVVGATGSGKTTLLENCILQDIKNNYGLAIIDPHGDMAKKIASLVPADRQNDVIFFSPVDLDNKIKINLLEIDSQLTGKALLKEKDLITESVISIFNKLFQDDNIDSHRIEYFLRNAIQTALMIKDSTLFTVYDLITDPVFRNHALREIRNSNLNSNNRRVKSLLNFWVNEFEKAGSMQRVKMTAGITSKIGRFLFSAFISQVVGQSNSNIDFHDIIDNHKILICDFSKGELGEDTAKIFGMLVLAKLQLACLARAKQAESNRNPFFIYVDEFQNFATSSFIQMLSESRKYQVYLAMAEQSITWQKDQQIINIILANIGTLVCFRTASPRDEAMLLPIFSPFIRQGEIANLPAYNFYFKLFADVSAKPSSGIARYI